MLAYSRGEARCRPGLAVNMRLGKERTRRHAHQRKRRVILPAFAHRSCPDLAERAVSQNHVLQSPTRKESVSVYLEYYIIKAMQACTLATCSQRRTVDRTVKLWRSAT